MDRSSFVLAGGALFAVPFVACAKTLDAVPRWRPAMDVPIKKTEAEWKKELPPDRYAVLREGATEPPFSGALLEVHDKGIFVCAACGNELLSAACQRPRHPPARHQLRHDPRRGAVRAMRLASGSRLRRRAAADTLALLHELARDGVQKGRLGPPVIERTLGRPSGSLMKSRGLPPIISTRGYVYQESAAGDAGGGDNHRTWSHFCARHGRPDRPARSRRG